jgi:hypothetical protein
MTFPFSPMNTNGASSAPFFFVPPVSPPIPMSAPPASSLPQPLDIRSPSIVTSAVVPHGVFIRFAEPSCVAGVCLIGSVVQSAVFPWKNSPSWGLFL